MGKYLSRPGGKTTHFTGWSLNLSMAQYANGRKEERNRERGVGVKAARKEGRGEFDRAPNLTS